MELLAHLFYFVVCCALIVVAWFIYLFFNNLIDKMQKGVLQGLLGTVNTIVLLAIIGIGISYSALSFFAGVLLTMIAIFLLYAGKKAISGLSPT